MHYITKCFLILFILNTYLLNAQVSSNLLKTIDSIESLDTAKERIIKYESFLKQYDTTKHKKHIEILYGKVAVDYSQVKEYNKTIIYIKKALAIRESAKVKNLELINKERYRLALTYSKQDSLELEEDILNQIIKSDGDGLYTFKSYTKLSRIESNKGDFHKALEYLNSALANTNLCKKLDYEIKIKLLIITIYARKYQNIFHYKRNESDLNIVLNLQKDVEKKIKSSNIDEINIYAMYNNLAIIFYEFKKYNIALNLYSKSKAYYSKNNFKERELKTLMNIGNIYYKQKKIKKAANCFHKVIKETNDLRQKADAYDNMGYYLNSKVVKDKIPYFQKAINTSLNIPITINDAFNLPKLKTIEDSGNIQDILIYLIDLAQHQVKAYKQDNQKLYLKKALQTLSLVDKLVSLIRYETTSEQSKLFWIEKGVDSYMLAVEVSYLLNDTESAFYFMEKNKALLLQEKINTLQTRLSSNIPDAVLEQEYNLHYKRLEAYKNYQEDINNTKAQENFVLQDRNYNVFMDSLQQHFPNYTKIKKQVDIVDLKTATANTNTCFVEYILNDTDGYGLLYCDNEVSMFKIEDVPTLQNQLITLKSYFTNPVLDTTEKQDLQHTGQEVFNTLFPFPNAANKLSGKHLTIIPDYTLETFPFEALSVSSSTPLKDSYFLNNTEISYLQSFSAFKQIQQKQNAPEKKLLAIAPHTFADQSLPELTGTKAIIDSLSNYTSSTLLYETEATHANFLKYRNNYEVIHLSTHAGTDNSTKAPWIAFKDYNMTLNELYGLENQAELVVLDACETNTGKLAIGEGTISLSRGFFFNGAQSVMASLWNVNEKAGNTVISEFYKELQRGATKSKALQNSKIKYLKNHEFSEALPYYWAAFTLTGSTKTIELTTKLNYTLILGIVGLSTLLIVSFFWFRKRRIT